MSRISIDRALAIVQDLTEKKRENDAARESHHKLRLLTSLTRHDILNQLNAIALLIEMAIKTPDREKQHEYLARAYETTERIEKSIGFTWEH